MKEAPWIPMGLSTALAWVGSQGIQAMPAAAADPDRNMALAISFDLPTTPTNVKASPAAEGGSAAVALRPTPVPVPPIDPPLSTTTPRQPLPPPPWPPLPVAVAAPMLPDLFAGGTDSLVARAVGSAEGTRTPDGQVTAAYYGHPDPGNGVWNLGTFSYQHGADSPEAADAKQLQRLQQQAATLNRRAQSLGLTLSLEETLNAIDLANQSPAAALNQGGYLDWLHQSRQLGLTGEEAILYARTRAFLDPDTQRWNAPGLGNQVHRISQDQARRMAAIAAVLVASPRPQAEIVNEVPSASQPPVASVEAVADFVIDLDLDFPQTG